MERALVRFVGAGLASLAAGYGHSLPAGAVADGDGLIAVLAAQQNSRVPELIARVTSDIWREWQGRDLPLELAKRHLEDLPAIMDRHRPAPELASGVIAAARDSAPNDSARAGEHARWLANSFLTQARQAGDLEQAQLHEAAVAFLLERIYAPLLADVDGLDQLMSAGLANLVAARGAPEPPSAPDLPETAAAVPVHEVLRDLLAARIDHHQLQDVLAMKIAALGDLTAGLAEPLGIEPEAMALRVQAAALLAVAGFAQAQACLADAEALDVRAAQTDMENTRIHMAAAAATRTARGEIDEVLCDYRHAVRHYAATLRYLPGNDGPGRWRLHMQQAAALERLGQHFGDLHALDEAVGVCWAALRLLPNGAARRERASTHLTLGRLYEMLALATSTQQPQRAEAAVAALRSLVRSCDAGEVELAAMLAHGLARSLWALGAGSGDAAALREAAEAGLAALDGYEALGDAVRAAQVRGDLHRFHQAMAGPTEQPYTDPGSAPTL